MFVYACKECKECWSREKKDNVLFNSMYRESDWKIDRRTPLPEALSAGSTLLSLTKTNRVRGETRYTIIATFRRASNGVDLTEFLTILELIVSLNEWISKWNFIYDY